MIKRNAPTILGNARSVPKFVKNKQQMLGDNSYSDSQEKLFAREFYNLRRSQKRRDLDSISLHKHPKSHLHGIFDKWKVQEGLEDSSARELSQISADGSYSFNQTSNVRNIPAKNLKKIKLGPLQGSSKMLTLPRIDKPHESLDPISIYQT